MTGATKGRPSSQRIQNIGLPLDLPVLTDSATMSVFQAQCRQDLLGPAVVARSMQCVRPLRGKPDVELGPHHRMAHVRLCSSRSGMKSTKNTTNASPKLRDANMASSAILSSPKTAHLKHAPLPSNCWAKVTAFRRGSGHCSRSSVCPMMRGLGLIQEWAGLAQTPPKVPLVGQERMA